MTRLLSVGLILLCCACTADVAHAQGLEVKLSPISPGERSFHPAPGRPMLIALGAFRLRATGALVRVDGLVLTDAGTADLSAELETGTGVQVYLDGGDGVINTHTDVQLSSSSGAPTMPHMFASPIYIAPSGYVDIWVVVAIRGYPELVGPRAFALSVAESADVMAPGTAVSLGTPEPRTNVVMVHPFKGGHLISCAVTVDTCAAPLIHLLPVAALVLARSRRKRGKAN